MDDRSLAADPEKKILLSAASKVMTPIPALGTLQGINLRRLSDEQKDELCARIRTFCEAPFLTRRACPLGRFWSRSAVLYVSDGHCTVQHTFKSTDSVLQVFRNQDINIHEQLDLGCHWGPLHKHTMTSILQEPGLEEVHGSSYAISRRNMILPHAPSGLQRFVAPCRSHRLL